MALSKQICGVLFPDKNEMKEKSRNTLKSDMGLKGGMEFERKKNDGTFFRKSFREMKL